MKKSSVVLAGVCACALAAFAIDRFAVQRQLETLEREYRVVRAAKYAPESYPPPPLHTEQLASLLARNAESAPEPGANAPAADPGEETLEDAPPSQSDDEVGQGTRDQIAYVDAMFSNEPMWGCSYDVEGIPGTTYWVFWPAISSCTPAARRDIRALEVAPPAGFEGGDDERGEGHKVLADRCTSDVRTGVGVCRLSLWGER